ncbi:MAG: hypothetical protein ACI9QD_000750, partial [Thermoproteota archaeon]
MKFVAETLKFNYVLRKIILLSAFIILCSSCLKEDFIQVCYDSTSSGCVDLEDSATASIDKTISLTATSNTQAESIGGFAVTVAVNEPSSSVITVPFYVSGTMTYLADKDFIVEGSDITFDNTTGQGLVTLYGGYSSRSIIINVIDDNISEENETLILTLGTPTNAVLGTGTIYTLTVTDDDADSVVSFNQPTTSAFETGLTYTIDVDLDKETGKDIIVNLTVVGTAIGGIDHNLTINQFTIPAESLSHTLSFTTTPDTILETDETIQISMVTATNGILNTNKNHTVTILDNDNEPYISFLNPSSTANEIDGTVNIVLQLSIPVEVDVTFDYTISGTANNPLDHNLISGSATILANSPSVNIPVTIVNDSTAEADETIELTIINVVNAQVPLDLSTGLPLSPFTGGLTIQDDEAQPNAQFKYPFQTVFESIGAPAGIVVTLSKPSGSTVNVDFTVAGDAINPTHHDLVDGTVSIAPGQTEFSIPINLLDDGFHGVNKSITVTLNDGNPGMNAALGTSIVHTLTIYDPTFISIPQDIAGFTQLPINKVNTVHVGPSNALAIGTQSGLAISVDNGANFLNFGTKLGIKDLFINEVFYDIDEENPTLYKALYLATNKGIAIANNALQGFNFITNITTGGTIPVEEIRYVVANNENMMVGTPLNGVAFSNDGGQTFTNATFTSHGLPSNNIKGLHFDHVSNTVTVLTDQGLIQTKDWGSTWEPTWSTGNYLSGNDIRDYLVKEVSGVPTAYILTDQGLDFGPIATPSLFVNKNAQLQVTMAQRLKVLVDSNDLIYIIGSSTMSVSVDIAGSSFTYNSVISGLPLANITDAAIDGSDYVYLTSRTKGIFKFKWDNVLDQVDNTTESIIAGTNNFTNYAINDIEFTVTGEMLVGTDYGYHYSAGTDFNSFTSKLVGNGVINDIHLRSDDEKIYIGTGSNYATAVAGVDPAFKEVLIQTTTNIPNAAPVESIWSGTSGDQKVMMGTKDEGLTYSDDDFVSTASSLGADTINDIFYDSYAGYYFVATNTGLYFDNGASPLNVNVSITTGSVDNNAVQLLDNTTSY